MAKLNTCILINSNQPENRYGRFAREILVSEGLTGFSFVDLADGRLPEFEETALILVTRAILRRAQAVSYTHLRAHETVLDLVCRLLLEKKKKEKKKKKK